MVKTKVTAKLICVFVFAYAKCWFSHDAAHFILMVIFINFVKSFLYYIDVTVCNPVHNVQTLSRLLSANNIKNIV